ncbi:MAG: T9SS type A sorting domain-containing protein [Candidatus Marinimicrobia bacterium]|nr:T9SS type A sorting domain-containing protein [Candidatus Neomarinimicrobiota bacterium]
MVKSIDASEWISNRSNIISIHVDDYVDDGLGKFASENDIRPKGIYPNPFNPETNISFEITHSSNVEINIFDINGRLIESVLNDYLDKGIYLYKWNGSKYSSGIYLLNLTADNLNMTYKLFLQK